MFGSSGRKKWKIAECGGGDLEQKYGLSRIVACDGSREHESASNFQQAGDRLEQK